MNGQMMDYAKLKADFDQQKLLLEKQSKLSSQLQMALDILNRNLLKIKAENEQLQQNTLVTAQLEELQTELKRTRTELLHHQQLHQANEQKVSELRNALRSINLTNEKLQVEQQQLREQQIEQFEQQLALLNGEKQAYQELLNELHSSVEVLATKLKDAEQAKQQQQDANEQLEKLFATLQMEHEITLEQIEQATAQYEQILAESDEQLQQLELMTQQKQLFEQQYMHILEQSTEQQLQFDESFAQLKGELQFEQEEKQLLLKKVQHLEAQNEEALADVELLQMQKQYVEKLAEQQTLEIEQLKQQLEQFHQQPSAELEQPIIEQSKQVEEMPSVKVATVKTDAEQLQAIEQYLQQQNKKDFNSVLKQLSKDVIQHKFSYDYQLS